MNLLIADDVGLGKTIEAGLVMQELLIRHRARYADPQPRLFPVAVTFLVPERPAHDRSRR